MMVHAINQNVLTVGNNLDQVGKNIITVDEHIEKLRLEALRALEELHYGLAKDVQCKWRLCCCTSSALTKFSC
jgi:hypothetical protein